MLPYNTRTQAIAALACLLAVACASLAIRGCTTEKTSTRAPAEELPDRIVSLKPVVTNLCGDVSESRYIRIGISVVFNTKDTAELAKQAEPAIKEALLRYIGNYSYSKATAPTALNHIKTELKQHIAKQLGYDQGNQIDSILITEYIVE